MKHPVQIHALMSMMSAATDCKTKIAVFHLSMGFLQFSFAHFTILYSYFALVYSHSSGLFFWFALCFWRVADTHIHTHTHNTTLTEYMKYISNELKVLDNPKPHNARNVDADVTVPYSFPVFFYMFSVPPRRFRMYVCVCALYWIYQYVRYVPSFLNHAAS